jgi:hypothetical protein
MVLQQVRMLTRAPEHYYGKGAGTNVSGEASEVVRVAAGEEG